MSELPSIPPGNGVSYRWRLLVTAIVNLGMAYGSILAWHLHAEPIAYALVGACGIFNLQGLQKGGRG